MFKSEFGIQIQNGQILDFYSNCNVGTEDAKWSADSFCVDTTNDGDWSVQIITTPRQTTKIRVTFYRDKRIAHRQYYLAENGTLLIGRDGKTLGSHFAKSQHTALDAAVCRLGITRIVYSAPEASYCFPWRPENSGSDIDYTVLAANITPTVTTTDEGNIVYTLSDQRWVVIAHVISSGDTTVRQISLVTDSLSRDQVTDLERYLDDHGLCGFDDLPDTWEELV